MTNEKKQQLAFQFKNTTNLKQKEENICSDNFPKEKSCVVRSIVNELTDRKKSEEAKTFNNVLSRINHLLC